MKYSVFFIFSSLLFPMSIRAQNFDLSVYVAASVEGLAISTASHKNTWGFGTAEGWDVDQDQGTIVWTFKDGVVSAAVQIIGTYNPEDGTFLWAWDHPSIEEPLQAHAKLVRAFGIKHKINKYIKGKVAVSEDEAWEFVAVANRLAKANGGYRGEAGGPMVFMTFGEVVINMTKR